MQVKKRDGSLEEFNKQKIIIALSKAFKSCNVSITDKELNDLANQVKIEDKLDIEDIQEQIENLLIKFDYLKVAKAYILYRAEHKRTRDFTQKKIDFINNFKKSDNAANATVDDNSNVSGKNIGILNSEIHKQDNILINRAMVMDKLKELFPDFDRKNYKKDLEHHIIYKNDESSFAGAISPYCCSITMYPFLTGGISGIGGLSAAPKNLDSFCGMYINLIFATSAMFAGAVATSELLLYFTYFCKKEWGDDFYLYPEKEITINCAKHKTIRSQIHQYWQQIVYSINQPAAARGLQSAFVNFSYFDKPFFDGMFGDFYFPDSSKPDWESLNWVQKEFMQWFNAERLKCVLTFPVESFALVYKDGEFVDRDSAEFVAQEYARGHSFFTYISDTVDSLSSCCFSKDTKVLWKNSYDGVKCSTLEELHNLKWEPYKKNLRIFHNGSWVKGRSVKLPNRPMYKITTYNNKEFIMSDNHINVTYTGEKTTDQLTTEDYLMFNTMPTQAITEYNEYLTYEQGLLVGLFLGDGTFSNHVCLDRSIHSFQLSLNKNKWEQVEDSLATLGNFKLEAVHNNEYLIHCCDKNLTTFIAKWTGNEPNKTRACNKSLSLNCLAQSIEFRQGILDGWYITDGGDPDRCYTISKTLVDNMEILCTSLGLQTIINISDRTEEAVITRGQEYNRNYPLYCLRWYTEANHRCNKTEDKSWKEKNNSMYWRIKSIEPIEYEEDIYCIECENQDEPYFTLPSGLITHNCRLKNMITTKEFNFTNGNMGVQTGSKSVITLNLNRIIQDWYRGWHTEEDSKVGGSLGIDWSEDSEDLQRYIVNILNRVYKYHTAYNELLWDMYDAGLLPVYKVGFIDLNKQYLTIGINGLNQAAEFLGMSCTDNVAYSKFCQLIFSTIKEANTKANGTFNKHKLTFNTECVPAESLAIKNYNWDKKDGYKVPTDTNLYASYIFKPNDANITVLDRLKLHGSNYIGEYLDGGSACHVNLDSHLSVEQYRKLLKYSAEAGCQYFTFNVPNCECEDCHYIAKQPFEKCPKCGSDNVSLWERIIGYLTKIKNWSAGRQIEQKTRVYQKV